MDSKKFLVRANSLVELTNIFFGENNIFVEMTNKVAVNNLLFLVNDLLVGFDG